MPKNRKKVDTWYFNLQDLLNRQVMKRPDPVDEDEDEEIQKPPSKEVLTTISDVGERKIPVDLFLEKQTHEDRTPPHSLEDVKFIAKCRDPKLKVNIEIEGTDIEAVRAAVWAEMDARFEISWHDYYKVYLEPSRIYTGEGEGFDFYFDEVWKGITWEGRELLKEWSRGYEGHYKISPWPGRFTNRQGQVIACIPRNDMTEAALKEFKNKIARMRDVLQTFLTPEAIMGTLTNMSGLKLLEASTGQLTAEDQAKYERTQTSTSNP